MDRSRFEQLVEEALAGLPPQFAERLDNVTVTVEDLASPGQMGRAGHGDPHRLLGLYEGIPLTRRPQAYSGALPDRITIFQIPIEEYCSSDEEIKAQVRSTVMHELGHYFGMSEEQLRDV
ncbi:MAG: metallopeptidase family protein [Thermoleophilia bacterium]